MTLTDPCLSSRCSLYLSFCTLCKMLHHTFSRVLKESVLIPPPNLSQNPEYFGVELEGADCILRPLFLKKSVIHQLDFSASKICGHRCILKCHGYVAILLNKFKHILLHVTTFIIQLHCVRFIFFQTLHTCTWSSRAFTKMCYIKMYHLGKTTNLFKVIYPQPLIYNNNIYINYYTIK